MNMTHQILRNRVECTACGDIIESTHRHDFQWCSCQSVAVDGGKDYLKRVGEYGTWKELSEYEPKEPEENAHWTL